MSNDKDINWLSVILNIEFQNAVLIKTLAEVSMVSKFVREKLKPVVFENIEIMSRSTKFESNVLSIAIEEQFKISLSDSDDLTWAEERLEKIKLDCQTLNEKHSSIIQDSFNEYDIALNNTKKFAKRFYLGQAKNAGYYLYPLINGFNNLTTLTIVYCNIPFTTFVEIGKTLPNLNTLDLGIVNLVKSSRDIIASSDISLPPNLTSIVIGSIQVATTDLLLYPYEYLFNNNEDNYSYEHFIIPKHNLPSLKNFKYYPSFNISNNDIEENLGIEEFLAVNPKLESLDVSSYNLKMDSSLNSLEYLHTDDDICFNSISNISNLDSINTLIFCLNKFEKAKNFRKLCMLCNNLVELHLYKNGLFGDPQTLIDDFLTPALPKLSKLKTLQISGIHNDRFPKIFDFTKFSQIEELLLSGFGSISNIKFDTCKSLKRVRFGFYDYNISEDDIKDEFKELLNKYEDWTFKHEGRIILGNKI
ncbi:hypothetical protein CONCODRAFT_13992 [Conidiobolus coronatus NRRL 28638]|uniref:RNI-like protein n=1 Tax=Conidiobolus coronatus (strain ATCC 28846 / CBS 209.66 / NRRL 28638) TaxID=796925 RepID=A0A137NPT3_CONC2|nr:hypothetical protein CONCODRAFT_13992 [Conidiobolus coronatus NRRL 28638]|eukprot:KXN64749.1 hypothetical protein CONCODRAFT_13992 [Conidiobolus coronatus NRRL 28638]